MTKSFSKKAIERAKQLANHQFAPSFVLFIFTLLCYGVYAGWMGFYWDDWPIAWLASVSDSVGIRFFQFQRPLSGWVLSLISTLIGQIPFSWQIVTLALRFASAISVWWLVKTLWPGKPTQAFAIAALFLVFPGFSHQFVSVNSAPHLVALILFVCSLALMVVAARASGRKFRLLTGAAMGTGLLAALTTDYFYGLELIRPLLLWIALEQKQKTVRTLAIAYWPFAVLLAGIGAWRAYISQFGAYPLSLFGNLVSDPAYTLGTLLQTMAADLVTSTWSNWTRIFAPPASDLGANVTLYFWLLALIGFVLAELFFLLQREDKQDRRWGVLSIGLGLLALLAGGIAFWVPGLPFKFAFPHDRLMLPMMLGSVLVIAGIASLLPATWMRTMALSLLIGFSIASQFLSALAYRVDWQNQQRFLNQLAWRVPAFQPGTTIVSEELPFVYETDNSFTAAINWIYAGPMEVPANYYDWEYKIEDFVALPYMLRYLDLRLGWQLPPLEEQSDFVAPFRFFQFRGSSGDVVLLHYKPDACLRIMHPVYDAGHPDLLDAAYYSQHPDAKRPAKLHELSAYALPYSDPSLIESNSYASAALPEEVMGAELARDWCFYFEKADLARQNKDWVEVAELGKQGLAEFGLPEEASELPLFIEGFALSGNAEEAARLSEAALLQDARLDVMLCLTWQRIAQAQKAEPDLAMSQLETLGCE